MEVTLEGNRPLSTYKTLIEGDLFVINSETPNDVYMKTRNGDIQMTSGRLTPSCSPDRAVAKLAGHLRTWFV